jgi:hypothetical protein
MHHMNITVLTYHTEKELKVSRWFRTLKDNLVKILIYISLVLSVLLTKSVLPLTSLVMQTVQDLHRKCSK